MLILWPQDNINCNQEIRSRNSCENKLDSLNNVINLNNLLGVTIFSGSSTDSSTVLHADWHIIMSVFYVMILKISWKAWTWTSGRKLRPNWTVCTLHNSQIEPGYKHLRSQKIKTVHTGKIPIQIHDVVRYSSK